MKTSKVIISAIAIMILFMAQSFSAPVKNASAFNKSTQIQQYFNKAIAYPEFAKSQGLNGFVLIQYQITPSGMIKIDAINGSNSLLINYIQAKLGSLNVPLTETKNLYAKFVFKLY